MICLDIRIHNKAKASIRGFEKFRYMLHLNKRKLPLSVNYGAKYLFCVCRNLPLNHRRVLFTASTGVKCLFCAYFPFTT